MCLLSVSDGTDAEGDADADKGHVMCMLSVSDGADAEGDADADKGYLFNVYACT